MKNKSRTLLSFWNSLRGVTIVPAYPAQHIITKIERISDHTFLKYKFDSTRGVRGEVDLIAV